MEPTGSWDSGKLPEFGAIFMSNTTTRRECFERSLFALPRAFVEFVRKVRAGMVLFLFDYQERKLYGVFQAVSDGGLNMVPHAYTSSRKSFPAQVRFRIVWKCYPLREHEFHDAIRDNYYEQHKFNFGLSEDQVKRLIYLFESKIITTKRLPREMKIKHINSDHSDGKINLRQFDDWDNIPSAFEKSQYSKSQSVQVLKDEKSVNISSSAPLELGDFIPLLSPEHCDTTEIMATDDQSSPYCSKYREHHPRVKCMYSDRIEEKRSVFTRLELSPKCIMDLDMDRKRKRSSADVEAMEVNKRNLSQRRKVQKGTNYVPNREETPKAANVFSRLNFNSESIKHGTDIYEEHGRRRGHGGFSQYNGHAEKNYLTVPEEMFDKQGEAVDNAKHIFNFRGMQEEKPFMNIKPEGKSCRDIGDRRNNHSHVNNSLSHMQQKKRKLVKPILIADSEKVCIWESGLDDQRKACEGSTENSTVETKSLTLSDMPCIVDPMKYLEYLMEQNQDQEKCAEKDLLPSFGASEMVDNHNRCLEDLATTISCFVADYENRDNKVINKEDELENLSDLNSVEMLHTIHEQHGLPVSPSLRDPEEKTVVSDCDGRGSLQVKYSATQSLMRRTNKRSEGSIGVI